MIPGANLLAMAGTVIRFQKVDLYRYTGRAANAVGIQVPTFAPAEVVSGSFQSVDRALYSVLGLDFAKSYRNFYSTTVVLDTTRGGTGDELGYFGRRYHAVGSGDWQAQDGWQGTLFVDIGSDLQP